VYRVMLYVPGSGLGTHHCDAHVTSSAGMPIPFTDVVGTIYAGNATLNLLADLVDMHSATEKDFRFPDRQRLPD